MAKDVTQRTIRCSRRPVDGADSQERVDKMATRVMLATPNADHGPLTSVDNHSHARCCFIRGQEARVAGRRLRQGRRSLRRPAISSSLLEMRGRGGYFHIMRLKCERPHFHATARKTTLVVSFSLSAHDLGGWKSCALASSVRGKVRVGELGCNIGAVAQFLVKSGSSQYSPKVPNER